MSGVTSRYTRILRRETHSPRSAPAIAAAAVIVVACAYAGTEIVLALLGQSPLLSTPTDSLRTLSGLADAPIGAVVAIGAAVGIVGLALIILAVAPGRRAKHHRSTDRTAVVVDNEVVASSIARHVSSAAGVGPDNVRVGVTHRTAVATITPASGTPVDADAAKRAVSEQVDGYRLSPRLSARVAVTAEGKVGS